MGSRVPFLNPQKESSQAIEQDKNEFSTEDTVPSSVETSPLRILPQAEGSSLTKQDPDDVSLYQQIPEIDNLVPGRNPSFSENPRDDLQSAEIQPVPRIEEKGHDRNSEAEFFQDNGARNLEGSVLETCSESEGPSHKEEFRIQRPSIESAENLIEKMEQAYQRKTFDVDSRQQSEIHLLGTLQDEPPSIVRQDTENLIQNLENEPDQSSEQIRGTVDEEQNDEQNLSFAPEGRMISQTIYKQNSDEIDSHNKSDQLEGNVLGIQNAETQSMQDENSKTEEGCDTLDQLPKFSNPAQNKDQEYLTTKVDALRDMLKVIESENWTND